jgi:hypothetical protein
VYIFQSDHFTFKKANISRLAIKIQNVIGALSV